MTALRLHVCDTGYDFSAAATVNATNTRFLWNTGLDWSSEATVTLHLSLPPNNAATGTPTITGTAAVGQELTATTGTIADTDGLPSSYEYQWIREDADGMNPEDIDGETASTYTLTTDDVGKKIKVRVEFTDRSAARRRSPATPTPRRTRCPRRPTPAPRPPAAAPSGPAP